MAAMIIADRLVKEFVRSPKGGGLRGALRGLWAPRRERIVAVRGISFEIAAGEIVGYIGPNGAGKSTTIKLLCGVLHPTSGSAAVDGLSPQKERTAVARRIGVVFGQRTQLYWDLRLEESFDLMRRIYRVEADLYRRNLATLTEILSLGNLLNVPVRQLSLGQRMRGEIAVAVLHSPPVLFLDEPTIGLDVLAKQAIRGFIRDLNQQHGTTVILTTHDLGDIAKICSRVMVINDGAIIEDAPLPTLLRKLAPYRVLTVDFETAPEAPLSYPGVEVVESRGARVTFRLNAESVAPAALIGELAARFHIRDLHVADPEIDEVVARFYADPGDTVS